MVSCVMSAALALLLALAAPCEAVNEPDDRVTIRIILPDGAPASGAQVGTWMQEPEFAGGDVPVSKSRAALRAEDLVLALNGPEGTLPNRADTDGSFVIAQSTLFTGPEDARFRPIICVSPDRSCIGISKVNRTALGSTHTIAMHPACRVSLHMRSSALEALERPMEKQFCYVFWETLRPIGLESGRADHEFLLPPGEFTVWTYGTGSAMHTFTLTIAPGERSRTLDIDIPASRLSLLVGNPAPELEGLKGWSDGKPVTLVDCLGKVVLLDFWGTWCGPCVHGMPELMDLAEAHKAEGLVVIAVHDDSHETVEAMNIELQRLTTTVWNGRTIPFSVALDGGGEVMTPGQNESARGVNTARYGIFQFPTRALIGRDGNVIGKRQKGNRDPLPGALLQPAEPASAP